MKEHKIGEVFEDAESFDPPKRLKCVKDGNSSWACFDCVYDFRKLCENGLCCSEDRIDNTDVHFIETTEPISKQK